VHLQPQAKCRNTAEISGLFIFIDTFAGTKRQSPTPKRYRPRPALRGGVCGAGYRTDHAPLTCMVFDPMVHSRFGVFYATADYHFCLLVKFFTDTITDLKSEPSWITFCPGVITGAEKVSQHGYISSSCDGCDGCVDKFDTDAVSVLPSLPTQPSRS